MGLPLLILIVSDSGDCYRGPWYCRCWCIHSTELIRCLSYTGFVLGFGIGLAIFVFERFLMWCLIGRISH